MNTTKIETIDVEVSWFSGDTKTYKVTGTRHAYHLLNKLNRSDRFSHAYVIEPLSDGSLNKIMILRRDIDQHRAKFSALLDRGNTHYDLTK